MKVNRCGTKKRKVRDADLKDLIDQFNQSGFVLVNENFEFPDVLGGAYEYLIKYLIKYFAILPDRREKSLSPPA
jgi:hypothetical protein